MEDDSVFVLTIDQCQGTTFVVNGRKLNVIADAFRTGATKQMLIILLRNNWWRLSLPNVELTPRGSTLWLDFYYELG